MEPYLLMELENLDRQVRGMGYQPELQQEIDSIRLELQGIGGASFSGGPMPPLVFATERMRERINRLKERVAEQERQSANLEEYERYTAPPPQPQSENQGEIKITKEELDEMQEGLLAANLILDIFEKKALKDYDSIITKTLEIYRNKYYPKQLVKFYRGTDENPVTHFFEWLYDKETNYSVVWLIYDTGFPFGEDLNISIAVEVIWPEESERDLAIFRCIRHGYKPVECEPNEQALIVTLDKLLSGTGEVDPIIHRYDIDMKYQTMILNELDYFRREYHPNEIWKRQKLPKLLPRIGTCLYQLADIYLSLYYGEGMVPSHFSILRTGGDPIYCNLDQDELHRSLVLLHEPEIDAIRYRMMRTGGEFRDGDEKRKFLEYEYAKIADLKREGEEVRRSIKRREEIENAKLEEDKQRRFQEQRIKAEQDRKREDERRREVERQVEAWNALPLWKKITTKKPS